MRSNRNPRVLRVASSTEREVLMFLGRGATRFALNPVLGKANPQALEDERCSLIGNSFHAGVFALVFSVLFEGKTKAEAPDSARPRGPDGP